MKFKRNIEEKLEEALSTSPALLLTGARQTGKTTLTQELAKDNKYYYLTFDYLSTMSAAKKDPKGFIDNLPKPVIIDEVQRVPLILLPIKRDIDLNRIPGRYILTGSANPLLINKVGESLAGRLETVTLFPLSQGELLNRKEDVISKLFKPDPLPLPTESLSKQALYEKIIVGGYPVVQNLSASRRDAWFRNYVNDILLKDIQNISKIEGLSELPTLLKLLAFRIGQTIKKEDLSKLLNVSASSIQRYLLLLETFYMISFCPPWRPAMEKRIIKTPRVYLIDTGIAAYLHGLTVERLLADPIYTGHLLENFVWAELSKQSTWSGLDIGIYYFRTASGIEVDIVLEDSMGRVIGIEIKNSDTVFAQDFKGLYHLKETLKEKFVRGIVLYTGSDYIPFGSNLFALPFSYLWQTAESDR